MALCQADSSSYSDTELSAAYTNDKTVPIIPPNGFTGKSRTSDPYNLLTESEVNAIVDTMYRVNNKIPMMPEFSLNSDDTSAQDRAFNKYMTDNEILKNEIFDEYCFYNNRYRYAIRQLISMIADATAGVTVNQERINTLTQISISLNQKLTDMTQIVNGITKLQYEKARLMDQTINDLNTKIKSYFDNLKKQAKILNAEAPAAELKKRMVEFTREKSLVSNNMLSFYFFMDVVALGILFYVYRAS